MNNKRRKLYGVWFQMKQRCVNTKHPKYKNYGQRGIKVCKRWLCDFNNFYNWALCNGYAYGLTLERENNDGNYTPKNCKWVELHLQNFNKTTTLKLNVGGIDFTVPEFSELYNISEINVRDRLRRGWSVERMITQPVSKSNIGALILYKGEKKTLTDWSKLVGLNFDTLYKRIYKYGWCVDDAFTTPSKRKN